MHLSGLPKELQGVNLSQAQVPKCRKRFGVRTMSTLMIAMVKLKRGSNGLLPV